MKLNSIKILDNNNKNFDKMLDFLLSKRKYKIQSDSFSVTNIIKDVRKNGDKALLKYMKKDLIKIVCYFQAQRE